MRLLQPRACAKRCISFTAPARRKETLHGRGQNHTDSGHGWDQSFQESEIQGCSYFSGQRFCVLCFEIGTPSFFSPSRVQISKQNMHRTFHTRKYFTSVQAESRAACQSSRAVQCYQFGVSSCRVALNLAKLASGKTVEHQSQTNCSFLKSTLGETVEQRRRYAM